MKILFGGDSTGTGFGTVTRELGAALLGQGADVRFLSMNEQPPGTEMGEPFTGRTANLGVPSGWLVVAQEHSDQLAAAYERIKGMFTGALFEDGWTPDAAIILGDMGSVDLSPVVDLIPAGFPAFHYVPIEGVGLPPSWSRAWEVLRPVAMTEFGADEIAKVTGERPPVIYHGVNRNVFWPVSNSRPIVVLTPQKQIVLRTKADCKRFVALLGGPDPAHLWLYRADRLMPRKTYPAMLRALAPVLRSHPEVDLLLHCREFDEGMPSGIGHEFSKYPDLRGRIGLTGLAGTVGPEMLNILYNAADVYVSTSAEGFGLTIAEAIACGTPAVGLQFSSVPEVIGPAGVTVACGLLDNPYSYFWATPNEPAYGEAVTALLDDARLRNTLGAKGPRHVAEHFHWPDKARQFINLASAALPQEVAA